MFIIVHLTGVSLPGEMGSFVFKKVLNLLTITHNKMKIIRFRETSYA